MFGSLSKREKEGLFSNKIVKKEQKVKDDDSDAENRQWDPEIDLAREKSKAFDILAKLVPQSEIFLSSKPTMKNTS